MSLLLSCQAFLCTLTEILAPHDPDDADSDNDSPLDGFEVINGFNPLLGGEQDQDPETTIYSRTFSCILPPSATVDADGNVHVSDYSSYSAPSGSLSFVAENSSGTAIIEPITGGEPEPE